MGCDCECKTTLPIGQTGVDGARGAQGIQGIQGVAGHSSYVYQAWARDSSGTGFLEDPSLVTEDYGYTAFLISSVEVPTRTSLSYAGLWTLYNTGIHTYYVTNVSQLSSILSPNNGDVCWVTGVREVWRYNGTTWIRVHGSAWNTGAISSGTFIGTPSIDSCNIANIVFKFCIDADKVMFTIDIPLIQFGGTTNGFSMNIATALAGALPLRDHYSFNAVYTDITNSASRAIAWKITPLGVLTIVSNFVGTNFALSTNANVHLEGFYERAV